MKPFRFTLQRVLDLRVSKLHEEERKLAALEQEWNRLDQAIEQLEHQRKDARETCAHVESTTGYELMAMTGYRAKLGSDQAFLTQQRAVCGQKLARQRETYVAARRECRLLEKLRGRQFAEWVVESNREQDKLASDLYLARWDGGKQRR